MRWEFDSELSQEEEECLWRLHRELYEFTGGRRGGISIDTMPHTKWEELLHAKFIATTKVIIPLREVHQRLIDMRKSSRFSDKPAEDFSDDGLLVAANNI